VLASNDGRDSRRDELYGVIDRWVNSLPLEQVVEQLNKAEVPASRIYSAEDMFSDPQYLAREMFLKAKLPDGKDFKMPGIVPKLSQTPAAANGSGPNWASTTTWCSVNWLRRRRHCPLARGRRDLMIDRYKRWLIQLCLTAMMAGGWSLSAQAEDTLIWLLRDLPPLTIFDGPGKDQGALDQLLPMLIEHLPSIDIRCCTSIAPGACRCCANPRSPATPRYCGHQSAPNTSCFPARRLFPSAMDHDPAQSTGGHDSVYRGRPVRSASLSRRP
jgi:hypothetical protein